MSNKISALTAGAPAQNGDQIPINRGGANYSLLVSDINALVASGSGVFTPGGRLTLTTGAPVTTSDVTAAGTLYYTPYVHNYIMLYNGATWDSVAFTERSISLTGLTTGQPYDVFCYNNGGTPTLELLAWTNPIARATALAYQNGRLCKSGALTRLYLGAVQMAATSQCESSLLRQFVANNYNRVMRPVKKQESTATWSMTSSTWRQTNAASANKVEVLIGTDDTLISLQFSAIQSGGEAFSGIGVDSVTPTNSPTYLYGGTGYSFLDSFLGVGYHAINMCERGISAAAVTFYGAYGGVNLTSLDGWVVM